MRIWGLLRPDYFNNKAQSLTELATFGSFLLLALTFLVQAGMKFNNDLGLQMRSFRQAMSDAYNSNRLDAAGEVIEVQDNHNPDPSDRFGVGDVDSSKEGASFVWGNTLQTTPAGLGPLPRIKYIINGVVTEYADSSFRYIPGPGTVYVEINGSKQPRSFTGHPPAGGEIRIYTTPEDHFLPAQAMYLADDSNSYHQIDLLTDAAWSVGTKLRPVVQVNPFNGNRGDAVWSLYLKDPSSTGFAHPGLGQVNPEYFEDAALTYPYVDDDAIPDVNMTNRQGLLSTTTTLTGRNDSLRLEEGSGYSRSTDQVNANATVTHTIRQITNNLDNFTYTVDMGRGMDNTWETPK